MSGHFFIEAPILSWSQWIWRRIWQGEPRAPSLIPSTLSKTGMQTSPTGVKPQRAKATCASEYSLFLSTHFYSSGAPIQLIVPPKLLESGIQDGSIHGVEIRTKEHTLAGILFCLYAGMYNGKESMGIITWHCVHPTWRKKGITNVLLRSIYSFTQPRNIYWFRNDGWLKSSVPPSWTEYRIQRKKGSTHVVGSRSHRIQCQRVPYTKWQNQSKTVWLQKHPEGLILDDLAYKQRLVECWELIVREGVYCIVYIQSSFEFQKSNNQLEPWCEIITWYMEGVSIPTYELAHYIETVLDSTPYSWFDAPASMPHIESRWTALGLSNWCAFGLDLGVPIQRPILSLCMV